MRQLALALALAAAPALASAQLLRVGTVQITGGSNLWAGSSKLELPDGSRLKTTTRNLGLEGFLYATPNVGLGLSASYEAQRQDDGVDAVKQQTTILGPAVTLHLGAPDSLAVYLVGSVGRAGMDLGGGASGSGWGYSVGGGLKLFPAAFLSVDLGLERASYAVDLQGVEVKLEGTRLKLGLSVYVNR